MRHLVAALLLACGAGEEMPAPRAPGAVFLSKNQQRAMANRNNAQQEARYEPPLPAQPYTALYADTTAAGFTAFGPTFTGYYVSKIKGVTAPVSFDSIQLSGSQSGNVISHIAVCEYAETDAGVVFVEIARIRTGRTVYSAPYPKFDRRIDMVPTKSYALAVAFEMDVTGSVTVASGPDGEGLALYWNAPAAGTFPGEYGPVNFTWTPNGVSTVISSIQALWCRLSLAERNAAQPNISLWY